MSTETSKGPTVDVVKREVWEDTVHRNTVLSMGISWIEKINQIDIYLLGHKSELSFQMVQWQTGIWLRVLFCGHCAQLFGYLEVDILA